MMDTISTLKALSDSGRFRIIVALLTFDEICVCQITEMLGLATATVSRHMSILQNASLVKNRKEGHWVHYRLSEDISSVLLQWLKDSTINTIEIKKDKKTLQQIIARDSIALCNPIGKRK